MNDFEKELGVFSFKDVVMLYHTNLRNVGLFISISLAMLGYSRYYRDKSKLYNVSFIVISIGFLFIATYIDYVLITTQNKLRENMKPSTKKYMEELNMIPIYILCLNLLVMLFSIYSFQRELSSK